jgi:hypothetical protein
MDTHGTHSHLDDTAKPEGQSGHVTSQIVGLDNSVEPLQASSSHQPASEKRREIKLFWTLIEAAAWVTFRDMRVVDRFSQARQGDWATFMAYPSEREKYEEGDELPELFDALRANDLQAYGRPTSQDGQLQPIPPIDWHDLVPDIDGPYRRNASGARIEPWVGIYLKRADVERLWRGQDEIDGRSHFDSKWFKRGFARLKEQHPKMSKNRLIEELQMQFKAETGREPPSRTQVQRYIKRP